ncbi:hypothetical protein [Acinetobacter amyesii]|uniref:hypothetical protein n=1 Tax=Acinetobacter amyesii TaxID=2942470 RepID=UPI0020C08F4B|nr:hypothetical protein [Acinetobacter amyesii]MCL6241140.1 hypothetical protein [Acinetobacter amyesii]
MNRKYLAESALHFYSSDPMLLSLQDIYMSQDSEFSKELIRNNNIYIICKRRKITLDPYKIKYSYGQITGDLFIHGDIYHEWDRESFTLKSIHFDERIRLFNNNGFTNFRPKLDIVHLSINSLGNYLEFIDREMGRFMLSTNQLVSLIRPDWQGRENLEVLYIGQSIGAKKSRTAIDRLKHHSTLQRILCDTMMDFPTDDIILLLYKFESTKSIMSTASNNMMSDVSASSDEELNHFMSMGTRNVPRKTKINLVEAALINYFKPKYNFMHKDSFNPNNMKKLKTLKELFKLDLSGLIVEINTNSLGAKLFSEQTNNISKKNEISMSFFEDNKNHEDKEIREMCGNMLNAHIAKFPLYNIDERESFIHALPWHS